jgi:hypothetical protein
MVQNPIFDHLGGLLVLSRFPIVQTSFVGYSAGYQIDKIVEKGCLHVLIKKEESFLHIFDTHLQATYHGSNPTAEHLKHFTDVR